ncbi:MAG: gliding motility lipoprotein GldH [Bacteroidales bacterium]|jgi:gliding motility-associated lipoprotein GldH|nr:gliding motility lipoprotein GldH [Bacteroidales bacterium]
MNKRIRNILVYLTFTPFVFLMFACDNSRVYEEWQDMEDNVWNEDSTCAFTFDIEDSLVMYNLNFGIRHTNLYPYQNIWLITTVNGGKNDFSYQDTIQLVLASKSGEWFGDRSASLYTYVTPLYRKLPFYSAGKYTFAIKHGMRKENLNGVSSIGFRIETTE